MLKYLKRGSFRATFLLLLFSYFENQAQSLSEELGSIHGNFQIDAQYYRPDSSINAPVVPEKMLSNTFGNINYTKGKFSAGIRYEAYNNVMQGFDPRYKGQGIVNRFARYQDKLLDVTVGNIYEQFGSGLLFRTYYEPGLLYDNSLDGFRVISNPYKGITLKALTGRQRTFFSLGEGIVRGFDGELDLKDLFDSLMPNMKTRIIIGGSFVSKYQTDQDPDFILPENVGGYGGRISVSHGNFNFFGEYVQRENDPGLANSSQVGARTFYTYKHGEGLFLSASYAMKGFSILLQAKRIDNMSFRSDRNAELQNLMINYLPATTRQHTYLMPAYSPYATQPNGEVGGMAEIQFKLKKGSLLGGEYGTDITVNYSHANALKQINVNDSNSTLKLYKTRYNEFGVDLYHDLFIEINRKLSKKLKLSLMLCQQFNNVNIVQHNTPNGPYRNVKSDIVVVDLTYKYRGNSAVRFEGQWMGRDNTDILNMGSWWSAMVEWNINTHLFVALLDQYNYGNAGIDKTVRIDLAKGKLEFPGHYPLLSAGYTSGPHRISLSWGKQRQGIFCVGGVCRAVPASNGVAVSITSSF